MRSVTALIDRAIRISNAADYTAEQQMRVLSDYTLPAMKRRLARSHGFLVAETPVWASADKVLSGVIVSMRGQRASDTDVAVIEALFVDPPVQGMGVGGALIDASVERMRRGGIKRAVVAASLTAVDFYAHMGFSRTGRGRSNTGVDTVLMERIVG